MSAEEPLFRVVRGTPTAEELAALVGAVLVRSRASTVAPSPVPSGWARSGRPPAPPAVGAGAWRASGLPR
ncbi:acyl-CoA carboxylase subunit epsilon [Micromonospora sp. CPCC 206060]|uniref:acyl-CoA carboxylase subunit epsilon n=1 Tax=Micromonospora sp. CPCC 206060 TaxID=3122406 RepID=UPI002FEF7355